MVWYIQTLQTPSYEIGCGNIDIASSPIKYEYFIPRCLAMDSTRRWSYVWKPLHPTSEAFSNTDGLDNLYFPHRDCDVGEWRRVLKYLLDQSRRLDMPTWSLRILFSEVIGSWERCKILQLVFDTHLSRRNKSMLKRMTLTKCKPS